MEKTKIPVSTPYLSGKESKLVSKAIESGWISSGGPFVLEFEREFKKLNNRSYASSCSSGTAALTLAVRALGLGKGDEVIIPNFTIISCVQAVIETGAAPVFIDCDPITFNISTEQIETKLTKNTKAIMAVHIYGLSCDMDPILEIAQRYNLKVIEDAAQAHGQTYKGKPCGSFGDVSVFSFYANKHITTGEGGMVLTDNLDIYKEVESLKNLCFDSTNRFVHKRLGHNFRMTSMQAAMGIAQLDSLSSVIQMKQHQANQYLKQLSSNEDKIQLPIKSTSYCENHFWVFSIVLKGEQEASTLAKSLALKGIETRPFFYPLNKQPAIQNKISKHSDNPISESLYRKGLYLPTGPHLTEELITYICDSVKELIQ